MTQLILATQQFSARVDRVWVFLAVAIFALAVVEGLSVERSLRFASAAAALKCTRAGGRAGIPSRGAVESFLAERES